MRWILVDAYSIGSLEADASLRGKVAKGQVIDLSLSEVFLRLENQRYYGVRERATLSGLNSSMNLLRQRKASVCRRSQFDWCSPIVAKDTSVFVQYFISVIFQQMFLPQKLFGTFCICYLSSVLIILVLRKIIIEFLYVYVSTW